MRIIAPGLYQIVPISRIEDVVDGNPVLKRRGFYIDPDAAYNLLEDDDITILPDDFELPVGIVDSPAGPDGTLILTLDLGDGFPLEDLESTSINSPLGPLSISQHYALMPTTQNVVYPNPAEQYATNWLVLDLETETTVAVDGGRIVIGSDVVDVRGGPDFSTMTHTVNGIETSWGEIVDAGKANVAVTTTHVIRAGTPLHDLLTSMFEGEDDGVLAFIGTDAAGLAAIKAIGTAEAQVVAAEMEPQGNGERFGTVLHFHIDGLDVVEETCPSQTHSDVMAASRMHVPATGDAMQGRIG